MNKILINSEFYPELLRDIDTPPKQIYVKGNTNILREKCIAIIGSRACTDRGYELAKKFAKDLASLGICIVSGMAKGIDTAAHEGAMEVGGKTIAVIGSGFNHVYPKENVELYNNIIKKEGAIITEYQENVQPCSKNFLERNRIVSGLSIGVLVIEAAFRSGTSVTAGLANKQGRKVFCLPHNIDESHGVGTNLLIQKKRAYLIRNVEDIINMCPELNELKENIKEKHCEKITRKLMNKEYEDIYILLTNQPMNIDIICRLTKKDIKEITPLLTIMELEGYIKQLPGKQFVAI